MPIRAIKKIQSGSFGSVFLAEDTDTKEQLILKVLTYDNTTKYGIEREINILERIKPDCKKYLMCIREKKIEKGKAVIILDYIPNSHELFAFLDNKFESLGVLVKFAIMNELITGLYKLHKIGIVHKDIKPNNILIIQNNLNIHYIDYGFACYKDDEKCLGEQCGTPLYLSPELVKKAYIDFETAKAIDVWALGVTFIAICFGTSLWVDNALPSLLLQIKNATDQDIKKKLDDIVKKYRQEMPDSMTDKQALIFKTLIGAMIMVKPSERATIKDMVRAFKNVIPIISQDIRPQDAKLPSGNKRTFTRHNSLENLKRVGAQSMRNIHINEPLYGL